MHHEQDMPIAAQAAWLDRIDTALERVEKARRTRLIVVGYTVLALGAVLRFAFDEAARIIEDGGEIVALGALAGCVIVAGPVLLYAYGKMLWQMLDGKKPPLRSPLYSKGGIAVAVLVSSYVLTLVSGLALVAMDMFTDRTMTWLVWLLLGPSMAFMFLQLDLRVSSIKAWQFAASKWSRFPRYKRKQWANRLVLTENFLRRWVRVIGVVHLLIGLAGSFIVLNIPIGLLTGIDRTWLSGAAIAFAVAMLTATMLLVFWAIDSRYSHEELLDLRAGVVSHQWSEERVVRRYHEATSDFLAQSSGWQRRDP